MPATRRSRLGSLINKADVLRDIERSLVTIEDTIGLRDDRILPQLYIVDPLKGDDVRGDGTSDRPLRSLAEWGRRLVNSHITSPVTVRILSDDSSILSTRLRLGNYPVFIEGVRTSLRTGVLTGSTTAENMPLNQRIVLDDASLGVNGWAPYVGKMLVVTSGPNVGACCWVSKHIVGTSRAYGSPPAPQSSDLFMDPTIASGDPYMIYSVPRVNVGSVEVLSMGEQTGLNGATFQMRDLRVSSAGEGVYSVPSLNFGTNFIAFAAHFNRCYIMKFVLTGQPTTVVHNCFIDSTTTIDGLPGTLLNIIKGVTSPLADTVLSGTLIMNHTYVYWPYFQLDGSTSLLLAINVGFFDMPSDALVVSSGSTCRTIGNLWGSGASGYGVRCRSSGKLIYTQPPTLTGSAGDYTLGVAGNTARTWNETTGAYTAAFPCTWANLADNSKLNHAAWNVASNAGILKDQ